MFTKFTEIKMCMYVICYFFINRRFRNDFYPFIYSELKSFDPEGHDMIKTVFGCLDREEASESLKPDDYSPEHYPVNMMNRHMDGKVFLLASPLTTALLIFSSKFSL